MTSGYSNRILPLESHLCDGIDVNLTFKDPSKRILVSQLPLQPGFDTACYIQGKVRQYDISSTEISIILLLESPSRVTYAIFVVFRGVAFRGLTHMEHAAFDVGEEIRLSLHGAQLANLDKVYVHSMRTVPTSIHFDETLICQVVKYPWGPQPLISIERGKSCHY